MAAGPFCPTLRPGVEHHAADGGAAYLWDRLFERRVDLGSVSAALVRRMDGRLPVEELLDAVAAEAEVLEEAAAHSLRTLMLLGMVEGCGGDAARRMARLRAGERPALRVLPETRFTCQRSGDCCQSYAYGPLLEEDLARLAALPLRQAFPQLGEEPYLSRRCATCASSRR